MTAGPLSGRCIVVTRAAARAGSLRSELSAAGATVTEMPATRIERLESNALEGAIAHLADYDWAIFTSRTAVEIFWDMLGDHARAMSRVKVAAVGPATTGALADRGVNVEVMPSRFVAEGLLESMRHRDDVRGARVLYATAESARDVLPSGLRELGATVDRIPIYRSVPDGTGAADVRAALERGEVDLVTFTAGSTVQGFVAAVGLDAARRAPAATIGPVTTAAAREAGLEVAIEARESTIAGLVSAVIEFVSTRYGTK